MKDKSPLTYKQAGVDIDAGNQLVDQIKPLTRRTHTPEVMGNIGGFGALFDLGALNYEHPVLVSGTDGVGTKLKLAIDLNKHDTIGVDLVAMCVNDILTLGAKPLFFLDYYATAKLSPEVGANIIKGISEGCLQSGCALIGGETAEMPGIYKQDDYDLAGFCVGVVEKNKIIDNKNVKAGDVIIGLPSSGIHSNGFSLVHRVAENSDLALDESHLAPTKIYVKPVLNVLEKVNVHAMAHITGGGLSENIPRVLPDGLCANIDCNSWNTPEVFLTLQSKGNIEWNEMFRVFNMGIGFVLIVDSNDSEAALEMLNDDGAVVIGEISEDSNQQINLANMPK